MKKLFKISALLCMLVFLAFSGMAQVVYHLDIKSSKIVINGTSTLHDWEMNVVDGNGSLDLKTPGQLTQLNHGKIVIPVKGLKSEHSLMDHKTYDALKEDDFPQITIQVLGVTPDNKAKVNVTIAGKTKQVALPFQSSVTGDAIVVSGKLPVSLADYQVEPPVALLGTIECGDKITVDYRLSFHK